VKISFVIPYFFPAWQYGGRPRSAFELARGLVRRGHSVHVLTTDSGGAARLPDLHGRSPSRTIEGIEITYHKNISNYLAYRHRLFWPPSFFSQIQSQLQGSELVHIHELRSFLSASAARAARDLGIPYVVSPHGGLRHLGKKAAKTIFDGLWGKKIARGAAAMIAVSSVEEVDARSFGVEPQRIRLLPNAIRVEDFEELPGRSAFRNRWNLGEAKIVLFLGRLHWIKGADLLLRSFHAAHSLHPELQLVIAGPDDGQEAQLRREVSQLKLERSVTFTGYLGQPEKLEALAGSDVTVVPSRSEVFALTAVESLMCGTPVLLSSACGLEPLPTFEQGVVSFENGSSRDLADKLLMTVGNEFHHTASQGAAFVVNHFSSDAVAARAEMIYEAILGSG
jgi:glycosyltransferase involved in cell wall biosynthesis